MHATEDKKFSTGYPDRFVSMQNAAIKMAAAMKIMLTCSFSLKENSKTSYLQPVLNEWK